MTNFVIRFLGACLLVLGFATGCGEDGVFPTSSTKVATVSTETDCTGTAETGGSGTEEGVEAASRGTGACKTKTTIGEQGTSGNR